MLHVFWGRVSLGACDVAYNPGGALPIFGYGYALDQNAFAAAGFDPTTAPNGGAGFSKDLSGNKLPNAPPFTLSAGAQYTMPVTPDWAATLRGDFYWQGNSFARIFNDVPYDQLHGYTNVNLSLIFTNQDGWQAMAYMKNVFNIDGHYWRFSELRRYRADNQCVRHRSAPVRRARDEELVRGNNERDDKTSGDQVDLRVKFLATACGAVLLAAICGSQPPWPRATMHRPTVWIELGGEFTQLDNGQDAYLPPFALITSRLPFIIDPLWTLRDMHRSVGTATRKSRSNPLEWTGISRLPFSMAGALQPNFETANAATNHNQFYCESTMMPIKTSGRKTAKATWFWILGRQGCRVGNVRKR